MRRLTAQEDQIYQTLAGAEWGRAPRPPRSLVSMISVWAATSSRLCGLNFSIHGAFFWSPRFSRDPLPLAPASAALAARRSSCCAMLPAAGPQRLPPLTTLRAEIYGSLADAGAAESGTREADFTALLAIYHAEKARRS